MTQPLSNSLPDSSEDAALYKAYAALLEGEPADLDHDDLMAKAEAAEQGGALAFLSAELALSAVPPRLLTRAEALAPRHGAVAKRPFWQSLWQQWALALGTVLAFGSGSYALATTLSVEDTSRLWSVEDGLFDTATDGGFFAFE